MSENKAMMIIPKECPFCNQTIGLTKKRVIENHRLTNKYKDMVWCYGCGYHVNLTYFQTRPIEDALRAENKRIIKLFELLTPGGSEFYNDPDRCYRFAKDSHATMGKVAAERNALRARVAELEEAMLTYIKTEWSIDEND